FVLCHLLGRRRGTLANPGPAEPVVGRSNVSGGAASGARRVVGACIDYTTRIDRLLLKCREVSPKPPRSALQLKIMGRDFVAYCTHGLRRYSPTFTMTELTAIWIGDTQGVEFSANFSLLEAESRVSKFANASAAGDWIRSQDV